MSKSRLAACPYLWCWSSCNHGAGEPCPDLRDAEVVYCLAKHIQGVSSFSLLAHKQPADHFLLLSIQCTYLPQLHYISCNISQLWKQQGKKCYILLHSERHAIACSFPWLCGTELATLAKIEVTFSKLCFSTAITSLMNSCSRFHKHTATHTVQARHCTWGGSFETRSMNLCAVLLRAALDMPQKVTCLQRVY